MTELDRFESRFAAAYRAYLDEAPVEVDAAAVAREAAARKPGLGLLRRLGELERPARVMILVAILLAALAVAAGVGALRHEELASDLPAGMAGTWAYPQEEPEVRWSILRTITIADCALGETCGRLLARQPGERCEYTVTLRDRRGSSVELEIGQGLSIACAWSGLPGSRPEARLADAATLEVSFPGSEHPMSFHRVGGPAQPADPAAVVVDTLPDPVDAAYGVPDIAQVVTRLEQNRLVMEVELIRPVPEGVLWRLELLLDRDGTSRCNAYFHDFHAVVSLTGGSRVDSARLSYEPNGGSRLRYRVPGWSEAWTHAIGASVAGPWVTVSIPLDDMANPTELGFKVGAADDAGKDELAGPEDSGGCRRISLARD